MRLRFALVLLIVGVTLSGQPRAQDPAPIPVFSDLFTAYTAGDRDIVSKTLGSRWGFEAPHKWLEAWLKAQAGQFSRERVAFLLEIAIAASVHAPEELVNVIPAGEKVVTTRVAPLGADAQDDAFELLWHKAAVGLLEQRVDVRTASLYLSLLNTRYVTSAAAIAAGTKLDPRFTLARAIVKEQACWQSVTGGLGGSIALHAVTAAEFPSSDQCLQDAEHLFDVAAAVPEIATEATIRGAAVRFKRGRYTDALATLDHMRPDDADHVQQYWAALLTARTLDALDRLPDAEIAYRRASTIWPDAPSPAIGLALALFKMNRRTEAVAAVAAVRAAPSTAIDPWWAYYAADGRFVTRWRNDIREMLK